MTSYSLKIVLVIVSVGIKAENYLPALYAIASKVYSRAHFEVNKEDDETGYCQISFVPIRTKYSEIPDLDALNLFILLLKRDLPYVKNLIFHNQRGHDWGKKLIEEEHQ